MSYTKENFDNYKKLNDELSQAQDAFTNRTCEVFHRIFTEYLAKYEIASSDDETIEAACLDRLGIAKQQYHDYIDADLDGDGISIKVTGWYGDHDETSYYYIENAEFLYDDEKLTHWIGYMSNLAEAQLKIKKDREKEEQEEIERKERAEYERLKAKYDR
jgi:hypothetical protein